MITIFDTTKLNGKVFQRDGGSNTQWTCIGVGTPPDKGFPLVIGMSFDSVNNRTEIQSFRIIDVKFLGDITK